MHHPTRTLCKRAATLLPVCIVAGLLAPPQCAAELEDIKVYSPIVEDDERELEILGNNTFDDDEDADGFQHHEFELEFALTDWWATSITASLIKPAGKSLRYDILGWENTLQLTEEGKYWVDFGMHFELEFEDENERANNFETRLMFQKSAANYQHTLNLNFEHEFGRHAEDGLEVEYIWRSRTPIAPAVQAGFEVFGSLGELAHILPLQEQEHRIGPAIYYDGELGPLEIEIKLAWLFGLTDASADHTLHWQLQFLF